jgi:hypothetical protein
MKWFITKRGNQPYSGPTWGRDVPCWFDSEETATAMATELTRRNIVGFTVEAIPTGYVAGTYPRMLPKRK